MNTPLMVPKMVVSPEFRRLQSPELVKATDEWLATFFGYEPLVLLKEGDTVVNSSFTDNKGVAYRLVLDGNGNMLT